MSEKPNHAHAVVAALLMQQLHNFAQGLGLDEANTRPIVEQAIADMPGPNIKAVKHALMIICDQDNDL